ncbi:hypothetical protein E2P81_ATG01787 [Venturia nashicola]|nr:hypothetical protein E2P81_ATG01787 [Venturia nashicola]
MEGTKVDLIQATLMTKNGLVMKSSKTRTLDSGDSLNHNLMCRHAVIRVDAPRDEEAARNPVLAENVDQSISSP